MEIFKVETRVRRKNEIVHKIKRNILKSQIIWRLRLSLDHLKLYFKYLVMHITAGTISAFN